MSDFTDDNNEQLDDLEFEPCQEINESRTYALTKVAPCESRKIGI